MESIVIEKVWITDSAVWVRTVEGERGLRKIFRFSKTKIRDTKGAFKLHSEQRRNTLE